MIFKNLITKKLNLYDYGTGPLDLLIIQGTPFCNIDCKYCYLPNRSDTIKISLNTIEKIFDRLMESNIIRADVTLVWHAGEPLVMPLSFYEGVSEIIKKQNTTPFRIKQNFQSNATLLNGEWCRFFKENINTSISVSIDGPHFIHDYQRVTRNGKGTFSSVMKGVNLLRENHVSFGVISVITDYTLDFPDEFYSFFRELNPRMLGLNIEEVEGANLSSTLYTTNINPDRYTSFMKRLYELYVADERQLPIREFLQIEKFVLSGKNYKNNLGQQTTPYRILSIDINGNFSTFSPELLTMKSHLYKDFIMGNVFEHTFEEVLLTEKFNNIYSDILEGVVMCKNQCKYYNVCGSSVPSNKYSEHNTFLVTETNHCKFKFQWLFDTVLSKIENDIKIVG